MKTKYFILLIISIITACKNSLYIEPQNSLTFENGLKTENDIQSLIRSIQSNIRNKAPFYPNNFGQFYMHYFTQGNVVFQNALDLSKITGLPSTTWSGFYQIIQTANIPLKFIERIDISNDKKNYYMGQAYFYKAFAYLWIVRIWGDAILIKDEVELNPVAKTSWTEIVDYAIDLAQEAVNLLPEYQNISQLVGKTPESNFVASKGAANALLAELAAWKAGVKYMASDQDASYDAQAYWRIAENACTQIIESNQYQLAANPEEVCEKVLVGNSKEGIFEVDIIHFWDEMTTSRSNFSGVLGPTPHHPALIPPISYSSLTEGFRQNSLDSTNSYFSTDDLRRGSYFYRIDSLAQTNTLSGIVAPNKYRRMKFYTSGDMTGIQQGIFQNWVVWRLAGIYLLRAESRVRLGDVTGAIADLNVVRRRAKAMDYDVNEGDLRYAIFNEKCKKEFLFEPHSYWFDMVRNGYTGSELKRYKYDKLTSQDLRDGALFEGISANDFANNPKLRQNIYWFKRFGY